MTSRKQWLDAAKGIGILLVAIGHNGVLCSFLPLHAAIFAFHMPLFFILSGITLSPSTSPKDILIRSASLYWVYLAVCLATIPFALNRADSQGPLNAILGIIYGCGYTIHMTPLWYLVCLAIAQPIAWALIRLFDSRPLSGMLPAAIVFILLGWLALYTNEPRPMTRVLSWGNGQQGVVLNLDIVPTAVGFLLSGRFMSKNMDTIRNMHWSFVLFLCACFLALIQWTSPSLDLNLRMVPTSFPKYLSCALIGSLVTIWICHRFNHISIAKLGASTLPILAFHPALTNKVSFIDKNSLFLAIAGTLVGVAIPFLVDNFFFKKYRLGQLFFYPRTLIRI